MPAYTEATEVEEIAKRIIKLHHPHKEKVNIGYLFREKAQVSGTRRVTFGMTVKVDDRNHLFNGKDVIIEIARDTWGMLDDTLKDLLVDHELNHVGFTLNEQGTGIEMNENGRPAVFVSPHDFEDFEAILDRYPTGRKQMKAVTEKYLEAIENAKKAAGKKDKKPGTNAKSTTGSS